MTRGLSTTELATAQADTVRPFLAAELDYPSGIVRVTNLDREVQITSPSTSTLANWYGCGAMGQVSAIQAGDEVRSYGFSLSLSGIPGDWGAYLRAQDVQGRNAYVLIGFMDKAYQLIFSRVITRAVMDTQDVAFGETTGITVNCESPLLDWERARIRRATDVDHRTQYPADGFFKFMAALENMTLKWGRA